MPDIPVRCLICEKQLKNDAQYIQHMESVHGAPKPQTLNPEAPPSPEFLEVAKQIDQSAKPPTENSEAKVSGGEKQPEVLKKLQLKYKWEGNCPTCNAPIRTIVLKANGKTIAVAYCLTHEEIEQREVQPLEKEVQDESKRRGINVHKDATESDAVQSAGMRKNHKSSISGSNG